MTLQSRIRKGARGLRTLLRRACKAGCQVDFDTRADLLDRGLITFTFNWPGFPPIVRPVPVTSLAMELDDDRILVPGPDELRMIATDVLRDVTERYEDVLIERGMIPAREESVQKLTPGMRVVVEGDDALEQLEGVHPDVLDQARQLGIDVDALEE